MLGAQVFSRHDEAPLRAPQLEIVARHLGGDGNLRVLIVCLFGP